MSSTTACETCEKQKIVRLSAFIVGHLFFLIFQRLCGWRQSLDPCHIRMNVMTIKRTTRFYYLFFFFDVGVSLKRKNENGRQLDFRDVTRIPFSFCVLFFYVRVFDMRWCTRQCVRYEPKKYKNSKRNAEDKKADHQAVESINAPPFSL